MNLHDLRISTRLMLGFGILALMIAALGALALIKTSTLGGAVEHIVHSRSRCSST